MSCASPALVSGSHWFLFVAVTAFIATLLWSFTYLLSLREALKLPINWIATVSKQLNSNFYYANATSPRTYKVVCSIAGTFEHRNIHLPLFYCHRGSVICLDLACRFCGLKEYCRRGKNNRASSLDCRYLCKFMFL